MDWRISEKRFLFWRLNKTSSPGRAWLNASSLYWISLSRQWSYLMGRLGRSMLVAFWYNDWQLSADFLDISWFFIRRAMLVAAEESLSGYSNLIPCIVPIGKLSEFVLGENVSLPHNTPNVCGHIHHCWRHGPRESALIDASNWLPVSMQFEYVIVDNVNISTENISIWYL